MIINWAHAWPSVTAAFLASVVEFVEALTVVLAVGTMRGWRGALTGSGAALVVLLAIVATLGPTLTRIPLNLVQLGVGALLLLFGMRWLRKAILRAAGVIALHDEDAVYEKQVATMRGVDRERTGWDALAIAAAFKITMLEGMEVVFIVIAVGAGGVGLLIPAGVGALAALLLVVLVGVAVHRPLASIPENMLKFFVGVLLTAFGSFWVGEGSGLRWPGQDWSIPALVAGYLIIALLTVPWCRARAGARPIASKQQQPVMHWLKALIFEIIGLFVDDGRLALSVIVWLGIEGWGLPRLNLPSIYHGMILSAGLAVILVESAVRSARN